MVNWLIIAIIFNFQINKRLADQGDIFEIVVQLDHLARVARRYWHGRLVRLNLDQLVELFDLLSFSNEPLFSSVFITNEQIKSNL